MVVCASASTINYNTTGSNLFCNFVAGCVQDTSTSVTVGGLTLSYNAASGSGVLTPSLIDFGNIVASGSSTGVNLTGLILDINVNSSPPNASATLPNGTFSGTISTSSSGATITFSPYNTTTSTYGTLPGVVIAGGGVSLTYQVVHPTISIQAPTAGNPAGQASIQGAVSDNAVVTPEPTTIFLLTAGVGMVALIRRRKSHSPQ